MSPENFAYWLQGFVELTAGQPPSNAQWKSIREHLDLVFKKVTPPIQTGPAPSTPDPMAGKTIQDYFRDHWNPAGAICAGQTVGANTGAVFIC